MQFIYCVFCFIMPFQITGWRSLVEVEFDGSVEVTKEDDLHGRANNDEEVFDKVKDMT